MGNFNLDTDEEKEWYSICTNRSSEHLGDCLELMPLIADESIDMILCDLPYGTTQNKWDSIIPLDKLWKEYERIIKNDGAIVLTAQTPFDKILGASNIKMLKYEWIWEKFRATGQLNAKKMPMKKHENILVFYKKLPTYNAQRLIKLSEPKTERLRKSNSSNYGKRDRDWVQEYTNYPKSVFSVNEEHNVGRLHPTQKPVALFEYLIKTYTNENDIVLDNTAGVFTTAVACLETNRKYIVMEKEKEYYNKGLKRILEWKLEQKTKLF